MAQSAGYKNPPNIPPFWKKETEDPPMELTKLSAMMEMAVLAKDVQLAFTFSPVTNQLQFFLNRIAYDLLPQYSD